MKRYEAVFILDIRKADDEGASFAKEFGELIGKLGGSMVDTVNMGRKLFTYPIDKKKAGFYYDFTFELEENAVRQIKENYKLDERILRNMIVIDSRPADLGTGIIKAALE